MRAYANLAETFSGMPFPNNAPPPLTTTLCPAIWFEVEALIFDLKRFYELSRNVLWLTLKNRGEKGKPQKLDATFKHLGSRIPNNLREWYDSNATHVATIGAYRNMLAHYDLLYPSGPIAILEQMEGLWAVKTTLPTNVLGWTRGYVNEHDPDALSYGWEETVRASKYYETLFADLRALG
jgi:hypothetical protein